MIKAIFLIKYTLELKIIIIIQCDINSLFHYCFFYVAILVKDRTIVFKILQNFTTVSISLWNLLLLWE